MYNYPIMLCTKTKSVECSILQFTSIISVCKTMKICIFVQIKRISCVCALLSPKMNNYFDL